MAINPLPLAGVGLAAVAVAGGLYATGTGTADTPSGQQTLVEQKEPTDWHSLFEDNDYSTKSAASQDYHGKYGAKYNKYFVGVTLKEANNQGTSNDTWWQWSYDKNYTPNKRANDSSGFKNVDSKAKLIEACTNAYKAEDSKIKSSSSEATTEDTFAEEDIWKFCSPLGKKPIAIKDEDGYENGNIGKGDSKTKLASAKDNDNDKFWEIKQKFFFAGSQPDQNTGAFFKTTYDTKDNPQPLSLKKKCHEAYGKSESGSSSNAAPSKDETLKYCSLEEAATGQD